MNQLLPKSGMCLVSGAAWSGKTSWVTHAAEPHKDLTWIGTAAADDPFLSSHIDSIRSLRPTTWKTLEAPLKLPEVIRSQSSERMPLVIDSVSLWLGNLAVATSHRYSPNQARDILDEATQELLDALTLQTSTRLVICVSAEMGASVAPESLLAYELRRSVGVLNQKLAAIASRVFMISCGIGISIK